MLLIFVKETFLCGLKPTNFETDQDALKQLKTRLANLFGNIIEIHENLRKEEIVEPVYGPFFDMAVKSWHTTIDGQQKVVYALTGCSMKQVEGKRVYVK